MSELSLRDRVRAIQIAMRDKPQTPNSARTHLMELSGLFASVTELETAAEVEYRVILADCYEREAKANRAKIRAEASPPYKTWIEAKSVRVRIETMLTSCRTFLRSQGDEMRNIGR